MREKETEAISGMHMPSGENMWAYPADDKETECKTPDSQFHITITPNEIGGMVELPFDIDIDEKEAEILEDKIHDALEEILAPYFKKEALGLTSIPSEQSKDYQLEQPLHIKDPDNIGVIDVDSVVDLHPANYSDDSEPENKMEELLENLIKELDKRGYDKYSSIIKQSQSGGLGVSPDADPKATYEQMSQSYMQLVNTADRDAKRRGFSDPNLGKYLSPIIRKWRGFLGSAEYPKAGGQNDLVKELTDATKKWIMAEKKYDHELLMEQMGLSRMIQTLGSYTNKAHVARRDHAMKEQSESATTAPESTGRAPESTGKRGQYSTPGDPYTYDYDPETDAFIVASGPNNIGYRMEKGSEGYNNLVERGFGPGAEEETPAEEKAEEAKPEEAAEEATAEEPEEAPEEKAEATEESVRRHIEQFLADIMSGEARVRGFLGTRNRATKQRIQNLGGIDGAVDSIINLGGGWENFAGYGTDRTTQDGKQYFSQMEQAAWRLLRSARRQQRREDRRAGITTESLSKRALARRERVETLIEISKELK